VVPSHASGTSSSLFPSGYDENTGPPLICNVTVFACCVTQCSSTCVGALQSTGAAGPLSEMIRTSVAAGVLVGASVFDASVDDELGGAVVVGAELAEWLLEHAASARNTTVADNEATRDGRITRS
jgi:hypothetical protein